MSSLIVWYLVPYMTIGSLLLSIFRWRSTCITQCVVWLLDHYFSESLLCMRCNQMCLEAGIHSSQKRVIIEDAGLLSTKTLVLWKIVTCTKKMLYLMCFLAMKVLINHWAAFFYRNLSCYWVSCLAYYLPLCFAIPINVMLTLPSSLILWAFVVTVDSVLPQSCSWLLVIRRYFGNQKYCWKLRLAPTPALTLVN